MKKNLETGTNAAIDRMTIVPTAVARMATDVSKKIYANDSLKDGTSVAINTFDIKFSNQKDSFQLQINNMSFFWLRDSVHYENFIIPKWDMMNMLIPCEGYLIVHIESQARIEFNAYPVNIR